ncbi:hypothetical protein QNA08_08095 [Chelatococcus sp. SYSU_G07232]|uniref:Uncharacterized protein n=1 Tax=Chelatococcus albus TaxID=3047466 RepID=A0ABT7AFN3_9HYPH|nr:hypothetical protein [Chelatococcus sp. SYSU_G07232]MDJ1158192.1 hypothetical protein [Chelatococcus sp. SYSU_G07232]
MLPIPSNHHPHPPPETDRVRHARPFVPISLGLLALLGLTSAVLTLLASG